MRKSPNTRAKKRKASTAAGTTEKLDKRTSNQDETKSKTNGFNDYAWYNMNPLLTEASARIPFPYRPGMEMDVTEPYSSTVLRTTRRIPGVCTLDWVPSVGQSSSPTDPASIAAKEIFAKVRAAFSGSIDADPPDFVIYLLALDSIFGYIGSLKRIYRILDAYTPDNYTWPDALLASLLPGTPGTASTAVINDFKANKALLWQNINELVGMTRKFRCPDIFPLFRRHYWMNDGVYTDAPSPNSQTYSFRQRAFFKFGLDTVESVQVGSVSLVEPKWTTVSGAFEFGRELIDALATGDDAYIISGYLTRAFDNVPIFVVDELEQFEQFIPYYLPEVLEQIHNTHCVVAPNAVTNFLPSCKVSQNPKVNAIVSAPKVTNATALDVGVTPKLSLSSDLPTTIDVVEGSRLAAYLEGGNMVIAGTEIPMFWTMLLGGTPSAPEFTQTALNEMIKADLDGKAQEFMPGVTFYALQALSAFDWAPRAVYGLAQVVGSATQITKAWEVWDIHNVTQLSETDLKNINKMCLLSEFNSFGSY